MKYHKLKNFHLKPYYCFPHHLITFPISKWSSNQIPILLLLLLLVFKVVNTPHILGTNTQFVTKKTLIFVFSRNNSGD